MSNIIKGSGIIYTTGQPNTIPSVGTDAEFAIDVNGVQYAWNRDTLVWDNIGQGIEIASTNGVPVTTPTKFKPRFVVTPDRTLYFYSGSWGKVNPLPSGVFSSSAQIGRTGIYSGSGTLNGLTIVDNLGAFPFRIESINNDENFKFILNPSNEIFLGQTNGANIQITSDPHMLIGSTDNFILIDPIGSYSGTSGIKITNATGKGLEYNTDYTDTLITNDRSIPDVGIIRDQLTSSYAMNGRNYKVISFSMSMVAGDDPVVDDILQNDYVGLTITANRVSTGNYGIFFNQNIFLDPTTDILTTKCFILTNNYLAISGNNVIMRPFAEDVDFVRLYTYAAEGGGLTDGGTDTKMFLEIRTYG
jgi:hypothetical protein